MKYERGNPIPYCSICRAGEDGMLDPDEYEKERPFWPKEKAPFDNLTSTSTEMEDNPPIIPSEYRINLRPDVYD